MPITELDGHTNVQVKKLLIIHFFIKEFAHIEGLKQLLKEGRKNDNLCAKMATFSYQDPSDEDVTKSLQFPLDFQMKKSKTSKVG